MTVVGAVDLAVERTVQAAWCCESHPVRAIEADRSSAARDYARLHSRELSEAASSRGLPNDHFM